MSKWSGIACAVVLSLGAVAQAAPKQKLLPVFSNSFKTGVGNQVAIHVSTTPSRESGGQFFRDVQVKVQLKDTSGYFAGAKQLSMPLGLNIKTESMEAFPTQKTNWATVTLRKTKSGAYQASHTVRISGTAGETEQVLTNGEFAFGDGKKWDSNRDKNYKMSIPDIAIDSD